MDNQSNLLKKIQIQVMKLSKNKKTELHETNNFLIECLKESLVKNVEHNLETISENTIELLQEDFKKDLNENDEILQEDLNKKFCTLYEDLDKKYDALYKDLKKKIDDSIDIIDKKISDNMDFFELLETNIEKYELKCEIKKRDKLVNNIIEILKVIEELTKKLTANVNYSSYKFLHGNNPEQKNLASFMPLFEKYFKNEAYFSDVIANWGENKITNRIKVHSSLFLQNVNAKYSIINGTYQCPNSSDNNSMHCHSAAREMEKFLPLPKNFNETEIQYEIRLLQILYDHMHKQYIDRKTIDSFNLYEK